MSDVNPRVSNGTCYTASGKELDSSFIPCGNAAFGHQTCCGKGDNCLADGACFGYHGTGYGSELTYWAGCSDPDYKDSSCPKKVVDQPWVALTHCDNSGGVWAICSQKGDPTTLQPGAFCSCSEVAQATVAFKDAVTLDNHVSLPQNTGDTLSFFPGYSPTATVPTTGNSGGQGTSPAETGTPITITGTDASGRTTTVTRTAAPPPNNTNGGSNAGGDGSSSDSASGLDTGAKIGIGVGVAVGGVLLIALVFLLLRRRRNRPPKRVEEGRTPSEPKVPMADGAAIVEADGRPAKPHKLRGELGDEVAGLGKRHSSKLQSAHRPRPSDGSAVSELEGSLGGAGADAGAAGVENGAAAPPGYELGTVAELPGSDVQGGNQGRLASDDSLVPAPLQVHHGGQGGLSAPPGQATTTGPGSATSGSQSASDARVEGAQVKPWGARWRRT